jgi:hypothetical protein
LYAEFVQVQCIIYIRSFLTINVNMIAKLFADASVWLACASVIATFDIRSPVKDGVPVLPPVRHTDGAIP